MFQVKEATDGLPGALAVCHALLSLGKKVTLVVDRSNATLFNLCTEYTSSIGGLNSKISIQLLENVQAAMKAKKGNEKEKMKGGVYIIIMAVGKYCY